MATVPWQRNQWECVRKMSEEDGVKWQECLRELGAWGNQGREPCLCLRKMARCLWAQECQAMTCQTVYQIKWPPSELGA